MFRRIQAVQIGSETAQSANSFDHRKFEASFSQAIHALSIIRPCYGHYTANRPKDLENKRKN